MQKTEVKKEPKKEYKSLRELILTPPEINYEEYFKDMSKKETPAKEEVKQNIIDKPATSLPEIKLKEEENKVINGVTDDEFFDDFFNDED